MTDENKDWTEEEAMIATFEQQGALLNGHFVLTSKPEGSPYRRHSGAYVNKDIVSSYPESVLETARDLANAGEHKWLVHADVIVAPAVGAIVFGSTLAAELRCRFAYAESEDGKMLFKRGFDKLITTGTRVVIVEDIVTSGSTLKMMVEAVRALGGVVVGVVIMWQRGKVDLPGNIPILSLVSKEYPVWTAEECEICRDGTPPDTDVGHGREFLVEFGNDPDNWPANITS